jgi:hypothetical protein
VAGRDPLAVGQHHGLDAPQLVEHQVLHLGPESVFPPERLDRRPQPLDDRDQPERADMRLAAPQDVVRRSGADKFFQHLAAMVQSVADPAPQLAVGERAGAALAELDVAFRLQLAAPPQAPGIARAFAHHFPAVQHQRAKPHLRQRQRRQQAARPGADHHRPGRQPLRRVGDEAVARIRRRADVAIARVPPQHRRFVGNDRIHGVDQRDRRPPPRIMPPPRHADLAERAFGHLEPSRHRFPQIGLGVIQLHFQFGQAEHGVS